MRQTCASQCTMYSDVDMLINFVNYRNQKSQKLKLIVQQNAQVVMELLATP